jgi:hypothetical protein
MHCIFLAARVMIVAASVGLEAIRSKIISAASCQDAYSLFFL